MIFSTSVVGFAFVDEGKHTLVHPVASVSAECFYLIVTLVYADADSYRLPPGPNFMVSITP